MNINKLSEQMLDVYKKLDLWPPSIFPERLCKLNALVVAAFESFEVSRKYGYPPIHDTCAISQNDCAYWEQCHESPEKKVTCCEPEGLAFRLADIVIHTLAMMEELGLNVDAVIMAEYRYLAAKAKEERE